jgi:membrane dipeptidase
MVNFFSAFIVPHSAHQDVERMAFRREQEKTTDNEGESESALKRWDADHGRGELGTIHTLVDHIDHIVKVAGIDCVGLGSDYDGVSMLPKQLEDASSYPYITQALIDRGYSDDDIRKILGGNMLRVLRANEEVAKRLKAEQAGK